MLYKIEFIEFESPNKCHFVANEQYKSVEIKPDSKRLNNVNIFLREPIEKIEIYQDDSLLGYADELNVKFSIH